MNVVITECPTCGWPRSKLIEYVKHAQWTIGLVTECEACENRAMLMFGGSDN